MKNHTFFSCLFCKNSGNGLAFLPGLSRLPALWFAGLCVLFCQAANAQNGDQVFNNAIVHEINITFYEDAYWDSLAYYYDLYSTFSGGDIPSLPATVEVDGVVLDSVGIRLKGKSSYFYVNEKKPFKLDVDEFNDDQEIDGLKKFNLQNCLGDPAMMRDLLAYDLMRASGVRAPRVSFCRLKLNGEDWGVYKIIEQIDKTFLDDNFPDDSGNLFKNQRWSALKWWGGDPLIYKDTFELKTNTTEDDWSGFINLLDVINNTTDEEFANTIEDVLNVDQFLHVLAVDVMINNWDSYISNARNWYMYEEPLTGKFQWIPWDYNLCFGGDISLSGNPYPPYDPSCIILSDFQYYVDGLNAVFLPYSEPQAESWYWDFGDGSFSTEENPMHTFAEAKTYNVCLTSYRQEGANTCSQTRCVKVNMSFDPGMCLTQQNGDCPYMPTDPIFQQVIEEDSYCCETDWDVFCFLAYQDLQNAPPPQIITGNDYDLNYPLLLDNPDKILVQRLLSVPAFKERYLDISCLLKANFFNEDYLFPKIDYFASLLRPEIHTDTRYNYTTDYFEYDVGNGTGGGEEAKIPALKYFFQQRFAQIDEHLAASGHDCSGAYSTLAWNDIVINELVASNTEESGISDADEEFEDWIELYNNTADAVDLSGLYLSDDLSFPKKWLFPEGTTIAPEGYLIVWADKDIAQAGLHSNFKLSGSGETLILSHEDSQWLDSYTFGQQTENVASARVPNGIGSFIQQTPTFSDNNDNVVNTYNPLSVSSPIYLFPNPVDEKLWIAWDQSLTDANVALQISDLIGRVIYSAEYELTGYQEFNIDFDFELLEEGCYLVSLQAGDEKYIHKLMVIH